jgi:PAP2 superfamily
VPNIEWTWQEALGIAGCLALVWVVLSRFGRAQRAQPAVHELALIIGLYGLWQLAGALATGSLGPAVGRGEWIWRTERTLHLPSEASLQRLILPHPLLVQAANLYYYSAHFTVLILFLIWLFVRHRAAYPRWRTTLAILTTSCLLIELLPVAPPRLVPSTGMVDTAMIYHQSVYSSSHGLAADDLSAMPSVHVAWASFVAVCAWNVTKSRWRYLTWLHLAVTVWVVVITGNHYWADGIVSVGLLALTLFVQKCTRSAWALYATPQLQTRVAAWSTTSWATKGLRPRAETGAGTFAPTGVERPGPAVVIDGKDRDVSRVPLSTGVIGADSDEDAGAAGAAETAGTTETAGAGVGGTGGEGGAGGNGGAGSGSAASGIAVADPAGEEGFGTDPPRRRDHGSASG